MSAAHRLVRLQFSSGVGKARFRQNRHGAADACRVGCRRATVVVLSDLGGFVLAVGLLSWPCAFAGSVRTLGASAWAARLESHWLAEETVAASLGGPRAAATVADAAGGCDGVIDGQWGFHTDRSTDPWWQVDLGRVQPVRRVVIWNRTQAPERASHLRILLSSGGGEWQTVYEHDGRLFLGFTDRKPLAVTLTNAAARWLRVQLPGAEFLHLDEVQVFGPGESAANLALCRPADQASVSPWSRNHLPPAPPDWIARARERLAYGARLARELEAGGRDVSAELGELRRLEQVLAREFVPGPPAKSGSARAAVPGVYWEVRRLQRRLALANPLLDFKALLFTKRVPASFNHMSDQYYGWWSKPGGGIYVLRQFDSGAPSEECLTDAFTHPGSFLRPALSYDARRVLFAWCRHYPGLAGHPNKLDKANVPEDAFYHLFEMRLDGTGLRQLTRGKYDDFDGRYLPDGRIVFLSTRRGQFIQAGRDSAARTFAQPDLPDIYVRCGGGPERPVAVYTLHTMNADGSGLCSISPFEMFEWTPEVGSDGSILYSRWDYVDRDNMPYMGLWAISPDGGNARLVYGNYTRAPHCAFEPKPVPGSPKIVFTASAHHAQTMGSLVLLDPSAGFEGDAPVTRLTPEVPFPEIEAWPATSYAGPWPLSERFHLVAWGYEGARVPGPGGWERWHAVQRPDNGMALYLFDAAGHKELLWADPAIGCVDPIPVRPRPRPPVVASNIAWDQPREGRFFLADVYRGLTTVKRGDISALRLVAIPPKTHPTMNFPNLGITRDDPGKSVLGTVPVEPDGSAHFRVPAGVILFFQALDADGLAVQTMRSATHVQPGQTLGCIGCHEPRQHAPAPQRALALARAPSRIAVGPEGSWTLRFDRLVQPVLDRHCVCCHRPHTNDLQAARWDLTPPKAYDTLVHYGKPSLTDQVWAAYRRGHSVEGDGIARRSALWALLARPEGHQGVLMDADTRERLLTWMDTYAQRLGVFSRDQEQRLADLRKALAALLVERRTSDAAALGAGHP
ncbi:MAG: discoidin domain-containing protein [Verrucomicrobia bacterium]|nr:discoidin domain-containing protein [Verrucomicrobiota bacterium]